MARKSRRERVMETVTEGAHKLQAYEILQELGTRMELGSPEELVQFCELASSVAFTTDAMPKATESVWCQVTASNQR